MSYRVGRKLGTTIYRDAEDEPCAWVPGDSELAMAFVNALNGQDATVTRLTAELAARTGELAVAIKALVHIADTLCPELDVESRYAVVDEDAFDACRIIKKVAEERDGLAAALNSLQSAARAVAHYHRTGYGPEVHRRFHDLIDHLDAMAAQTEAATVKEFSKVQPEEGANG